MVFKMYLRLQIGLFCVPPADFFSSNASCLNSKVNSPTAASSPLCPANRCGVATGESTINGEIAVFVSLKTHEFRSKLMVLVLPLRWNLFFKIFTGFRPRKLAEALRELFLRGSSRKRCK